MTAHRLFGTLTIVLGCALPLAAYAQATAGADPQNALAPLTTSYFDALAQADGRALGTLTSASFHVILPDGKRLGAEGFFRGLAEHHLIASTPVGNVKIGATAFAGGVATETVVTDSWDYALIGAGHGQVLERDYATHRLSWIKGTDGAWLLDEDHVTAAVHAP
jgi:hypothetical protein